MKEFNKTIYITLDMDWACDEVLSFAIDIIEENDIEATFFVTHDTPLLQRLRANKKIELGAHPNFNYLLTNQSKYSAEQIIKSIREIVPESISIRSHALTTGSMLSTLFFKYGFTRESNIYYYAKNTFIPDPYYDVSGILRILHFWEDDCHCLAIEKGIENDWNAHRFLYYLGTKVYDFHPIHLFLNTCNIKDYYCAKGYIQKPDMLIKYKNELDIGSFMFFVNTIKAAKQNNFKFGLIRDINITF